MKVLMKRNLKLFFRDRGAVLFSLLSVFIIIALYAVFLGDVWLNESMRDIPNAKLLMNSWLAAGLLAVSSVTTTLGAFGVMIDDKERKIDKDFHSSPIPKSGITGGYLASACLIGVIMSLVTAAAAQLYIKVSGGDWFGLSVSVKVVLLVLVGSLANTSMVCFMVSFFVSHSAYSTVGTIVGTLIGFLTGIYLPIGALPASVQAVMKAFPVSHVASLFRQALMEAPMKSAFHGIPARYLDEFQEYMGVTYRFGGQELAPWGSLLVLAGTAVVFFGLSLFNMSGKRQ